MRYPEILVLGIVIRLVLFEYLPTIVKNWICWYMKFF